MINILCCGGSVTCSHAQSASFWKDKMVFIPLPFLLLSVLPPAVVSSSSQDAISFLGRSTRFICKQCTKWTEMALGRKPTSRMGPEAECLYAACSRTGMALVPIFESAYDVLLGATCHYSECKCLRECQCLSRFRCLDRPELPCASLVPFPG